MPLHELIDEEQRLKDSVSYLSRQLADAEKRLAEIDATISLRFSQEQAILASRWAKVEELEKVQKAEVSSERKEIDKEIHRLQVMGLLQIKEDERLRKKEKRLHDFERDRLKNANEAIANLEKSEEIKEASEKAQAEVRKSLADLEEKRQEVELRIQTVSLQQEELFQDQKRLNEYEKKMRIRDEHSLMSEAKALTEQKRAAEALSEIAKQRDDIAALQAGIDKQMATLKDLIKQVNEKSIRLTHEQDEVKGIRQSLMDRMVSLDIRESKLKKKEKGE